MRFGRAFMLGIVSVVLAGQFLAADRAFIAGTAAVEDIRVPKELLELRPAEGLIYFRDQPFTGTSVSRYENGQIATSIAYANGKKQGPYRKWFEDGQLSFECFYRDGKKQGAAKSWWSNGKLRSASNYDRGVAHGLQEEWYSSGAKFKEIQLVYGREEGPQRAWRENGKIYNNYEAKNGRIFGLKRANLCYELDKEEIQYAE
ncbi:toxin-antitoxin system YwqK family antitoxin [Flavilitoribacter nigricans]|uniref:toxin-antitoxin system YwqK family antitoxin n=1 Tax=Flavilitoribacter nigricans TaxID=70997 RepID=UPI001C9E255E|nr:toxin-antitoxin system YwqK family antitoxin [Flavilitoribacter nigricans]